MRLLPVTMLRPRPLRMTAHYEAIRHNSVDRWTRIEKWFADGDCWSQCNGDGVLKDCPWPRAQKSWPGFGPLALASAPWLRHL